MSDSEQACEFTRFEAVCGALSLAIWWRAGGDVDPDHLGRIIRAVQGMIASVVVVYMSCQPVGFRKGAASSMAPIHDRGPDPFSGALHVFRFKGADRVRIVWWDGNGVCLYSKTLKSTASAGLRYGRRGYVWIIRS